VSALYMRLLWARWADGCPCSLTPTLSPSQPVEIQPMQTPIASLPPPQGQVQNQSQTPVHNTRKRVRDDQVTRQLQPPPQAAPQPIQPHPEQPISSIPTVESLVHTQAFNYPIYSSSMHPAPRDLHNSSAPQTWQGSTSIAPQQTHISPPPPHQIMSRTPAYAGREGNGWNEYEHPTHSGHSLAPPATYDYGYLANQAQYYDPAAVRGLYGTLGLKMLKCSFGSMITRHMSNKLRTWKNRLQVHPHRTRPIL